MSPRAKVTPETENQNVDVAPEVPETNNKVFSPENMRYYEYAREVPKEAQKQFNNGNFSGTDISPMWRIKMLTEMFGPAGIGWYTDVLKEQMVDVDDETTFAFMDINLYVRVNGEWSKPIFGTGGNKFKYKTQRRGVVTSDEGFKMAYTDALSVACKALGVGANIYFANDPTKYTDNTETSADRNPPPQKPPAKAETPTITAVVELTENPDAVSQDMLTNLVKNILDKIKNDSAAKSKVAATIKQYNNGAAAYKNITDAEIRKKIYDALYSEHMKTAPKGEN